MSDKLIELLADFGIRTTEYQQAAIRELVEDHTRTMYCLFTVLGIAIGMYLF